LAWIWLVRADKSGPILLFSRPEARIANCDNLVTAYQDDLLEYITTSSPERMTEVDRALRFALAL
jgi:mRNA-degrading endonuclease toxin of MazEF toxin-antitoxin module